VADDILDYYRRDPPKRKRPPTTIWAYWTINVSLAVVFFNVTALLAYDVFISLAFGPPLAVSCLALWAIGAWKGEKGRFPQMALGAAIVASISAALPWLIELH
jgi:hypothetical protein